MVQRYGLSSIELSSAQAEFVWSSSGALVLRAGAGSGKTEVIVHRVARILSESPAEEFRVLTLSYTVKAADQLRERSKARLGTVGHRLEADTIHGFAHNLIRQHGSRVGVVGEPELLRRDEDRVDLLLSWLRDTGRELPDNPRSALAQIDLDRAMGRESDLVYAWRDALQSASAIDYSSMLELATELLEGRWITKYLRRVYRTIIIDEAQNLTRAQCRFLSRLIGEPSDHIDFAMVGDPRQSIVGFAGAESHLMEEFSDAYRPDTIELNTNFRSAFVIVQAAHRIAQALERKSDNVGPVDVYPAIGHIEQGAYQDENSEGSGVADRISQFLRSGLDQTVLAPGEPTTVHAEDIAVLARTAASLNPVRSALEGLGIECTAGSGEADWLATVPANAALELINHKAAPKHRYTRKRLADLAMYSDGARWQDARELFRRSPVEDIAKMEAVAAAVEPSDLIARLQGLSISDVGWQQDLTTITDAWVDFSDTTSARERTFSNFQHFISRRQRGNVESSGVRLLTIHRAQGREFKVVFLVACNDGQIPDFRAKTKDEERAELRAFYVAVTRAARYLIVTRAMSRGTRFGPRKSSPSRFLHYLT